MDISFEFFPPKTMEGLHQLRETAQQLLTCDPTYFSVTYGAGGSTQTQTLKTVALLATHVHPNIAPHISCIGATQNEIMQLLTQYNEMQLRKLVVLRGDLPPGVISVAGDFRYASDLVAFIRQQFKDLFEIEVAAYPESHPQTPSIKSDLFYFKQKIEAGANGAITQYFYDANAYYFLLEDCHRLGIHVPITPGIMPITNLAQLMRFSELCGASIPRWLLKRLESYQDNVAAIQAFGIDVVAQLCEQLIAMGAPGLHFYTLNKSEVSLKVINSLKQSVFI